MLVMRELISAGLMLGFAVAGLGQDAGLLPAVAPVVVQAIGSAGGAGMRHEVAMPEGVAGPLGTLHVYTNLMQIPTLILTAEHGRLSKPVPEAKFRVSRDGGPPFPPTHVKREGDDPIELGILVDATKAKNTLLPGLVDAVAALAPGSLKERDHVSVYVMGCTLIRSANDLPVSESALRGAVERGLEGWKNSSLAQQGSACAKPVGLWDSMSFVTRQLSQTKGRRVLLVVSDGADHGSKTPVEVLTKLAQRSTTAVFGVMTPEDMTAGKPVLYSLSSAGLIANALADLPDPKDPFNRVCEASGGVELAAEKANLGKTLQRFVEMLRERYIVEYPRGDYEVAGEHTLRVTVGRSDDYIRSSGIEVPVADVKTLTDPNTLKSVGAPR